MRTQKKLHKSRRKYIRFSPRQEEQIERALKQESARCGETIDFSSFARRVVMDGVRRILEGAA